MSAGSDGIEYLARFEHLVVGSEFFIIMIVKHIQVTKDKSFERFMNSSEKNTFKQTQVLIDGDEIRHK